MATTHAGDLDIEYRIEGSGPALLLVAGTGYAGATWLPRLVELLAETSTVITYDHRGTGGTHGPTERLTTRLLAHDAVGLLDSLGVDRAAVLGHSMGGRVAQWIALDAPDRVSELVLAASGPGPMPGRERPVTGVPVPVAVALAELGYEGYVRRQQQTTFFTADAVEGAHPAVEWLARAFWASRPTLTDYLRHVAARQQHDTLELLAGLRQPTLVVVGDQDTHAGGTGSHVEQSRVLAEVIPDATLRVLPGLRHGWLWEAPEESARCITSWLVDRGAADDGPRPSFDPSTASRAGSWTAARPTTAHGRRSTRRPLPPDRPGRA